MRNELLEGKLGALQVVVETADAEHLTSDEMEGWLGALESLRLYLGTQLDVTEGTYEVTLPATTRPHRRWRCTATSAGSKSRPSRRCPRACRSRESTAASAYGSTRTRPAGSSRLACTASSIRSSGKVSPRSERQLEVARRDMLQQERQRDGRVLGAVHRPGEDLLPAQELARVEIEAEAGRRQADHHRRAPAAREAERRRARLGEADGVEPVVGPVGRDPRQRLLELRRLRPRASRRAGAPARAGPRPGRRRRSPRRRRSARPGRRTGRRRPRRRRAPRRLAARARRTAPRRRPVSAAQPSSAASRSGTAPPVGRATFAVTTTRSAQAPVAVPR